MSSATPLTNEDFSVFSHVALPVWVFSIETLNILKANCAAQDWLGYDESQLQSMTILELRPEAEREAVVAKLRSFDASSGDAGLWTMISADGRQFKASIYWSKVKFEGESAILASVRDGTESLPDEKKVKGFKQDPKVSAQQREMSKDLVRTVIDSLPGKIMVLTPDGFEIVAVTEDYAQAIMLDRDSMPGRCLLDLFPAEATAAPATGASSLRASLERVRELKSTDVMIPQRYLIHCGDGVSVERAWLPSNKPVVTSDGVLHFIIHHVEDVTGLVNSAEISPAQMIEAEPGTVTSGAAAQVALQALLERDKRLASAEKLLAIGAWEMDMRSGAMNWSDRVFDIYGLSRADGPPSFDRYVALVHPDDRKRMLALYREFVETESPEILFEHRIVKPDGTVAHVRGVGARQTVEGREIFVGVVQDITWDKEAEEQLRRRALRRQLAGRLVRLGHWRVTVGDMHVTWSAETAAIHDEPAGVSPTLEQSLRYYLPGYRDMVRRAIESCLSDGIAFDKICELETRKGKRVWVRTIGEAIRNARGNIVAVEGAFQDVSDLMTARDAVIASARRLYRMIENISDGFYMLDADWRFAFVNSQAEALLGFSRKELLGQNVWELFPEAAYTIRPHFERAIAACQKERFETLYESSGTWYEVAADPTPEGLAVYFRDVTEERKRFQQLRLLEAAVSRTNDIFIVTEADPVDTQNWPRIVYVNDAFTRKTGFTKEEAIGATPRILQDPKTDRAELDRLREVLKTRQPIRSEQINYTKSGDEFWVEKDIVPLADNAGRITHLVAVERDVTERKRVEEALKANEERFQFVTRASGTTLWEWDVINNRDWWSEGFLEVFGHQPDDANAQPKQWLSYIHPKDKARVDESIRRLLDGEADFALETYRFRRGDGSWAYVEDRSFSVCGSDGKVARILGSMTDISEKVQLEERLQQSQKMEAVGQLTGGVAHDFNNLLTIILGNAELLVEDLEHDPALKRLADMTMSAAERGAELTSRLLSFSRKQVLAPKVIDPGKLLLEMDGLLRRTLPENIDLEIIRSGGLWKAELDSGQLESALLNLALNARDAMPAGGCLTLEASNASLDEEYVSGEVGLTAGQYVLLTVTDTGHGIPQEALHRVFEPFFTTKQAGRGSGLGLSMVYGFVKQSGGHIRVYSEPGDGTAFKLYFPRVVSRSAVAEEMRPQPEVTGGSETILVVEDEQQVRQHVMSQLASLGYKVIGAASGVEAHRKLLAGLQIDLLFTDVVMPGGMSGRDLAEKALEIKPGLRILFTSGYTESSIVHNGKLDQGIDLLTKPYRRAQLAAKIRKVLEQR